MDNVQILVTNKNVFMTCECGQELTLSIYSDDPKVYKGERCKCGNEYTYMNNKIIKLY